MELVALSGQGSPPLLLPPPLPPLPPPALVETVGAAASPPQLDRREEEALRMFLDRIRNILPFLVLFVLQFLYSHVSAIAFFVCYTLLVHKLNQDLKTQIALKEDRDPKALALIVVSCMAAVSAALILDAQAQQPLFLFSLPHSSGASTGEASIDAAAPIAGASAESVAVAPATDAAAAAGTGAGEAADGIDGLGQLNGLGLGAPASLSDLLLMVLAADVCVRVVFTAFKALVALWPLTHKLWRPYFPAACLRWLQKTHIKKTHPQRQSLGGSTSSSHSRTRSLGSSTFSSRALLERGGGGGGSSVYYVHERRYLALLESISLLVRTVLPIPAWVSYYAAGTYGDMFLWMYLSFKCMVLSRHAKSMLAALWFAFSTNLEFGRTPTPEEVAEAAGECPVCYEQLDDADRLVILPCHHVFCLSCISDWLDQSRDGSCPVCRAVVRPNFESWRRCRSGSTSAIPCIL